MKTLLALAVLCVPAYAGNCHVARVVNRQVVVANAVVVPQNFIAVPVAQPLAVPSYYGYQYLPQFQAHAADPFRAEPAKALEAEPAQDAPPVPFSLTAQHCVKCHSGATPKGKLDLSGELSPETRLKMIQRILADDPAKRMPKGKPLDPQGIGLLIQELSQVPPNPEEVKK